MLDFKKIMLFLAVLLITLTSALADIGIGNNGDCSGIDNTDLMTQGNILTNGWNSLNQVMLKGETHSVTFTNIYNGNSYPVTIDYQVFYCTGYGLTHCDNFMYSNSVTIQPGETLSEFPISFTPWSIGTYQLDWRTSDSSSELSDGCTFWAYMVEVYPRRNECTPGTVQTKQCGTSTGVCEYGYQERTCNIKGKWSVWSECIGAVNPTEEICGDGLDNDCNGQTDENCEIVCNNDDDCGTSGPVGDAYCFGNYLYQDYIYNVCICPGAIDSYCDSWPWSYELQKCTYGCFNGECLGPSYACSDDVDNDGDLLIDENDPGCHTDLNPDNPDSYDPYDNDESNIVDDTEPVISYCDSSEFNVFSFFPYEEEGAPGDTLELLIKVKNNGCFDEKKVMVKVQDLNTGYQDIITSSTKLQRFESTWFDYMFEIPRDQDSGEQILKIVVGNDNNEVYGYQTYFVF
ncbi:MAG: hypothetical protein PHG05_03385 [Candidatus Nanoarchaeia archaeon]|nr:hypothetical protein [Candidatus Nanoarchaeia archaeon]